jgi:hypothetical protein
VGLIEIEIGWLILKTGKPEVKLRIFPADSNAMLSQNFGKKQKFLPRPGRTSIVVSFQKP